MRAAGLGAAWALWVVATAWGHRPAPIRARALVAAGAPPVPPRRRPRPAAALGHLVLAACTRGRGAARHPATEARLGRALVAAGLAGLVDPLAAPAAGLAAWALPTLGRRRARRREAAALRRHLPEAVDLLSLAVGAGMNVPLAVEAVARRAPGPVAEALGTAVGATSRGRRLADALDELPAALGEDARPLVAILAGSLRYGTSAVAGLDQLAAELRTDRRRGAEAAARRVPVKLLFPLVCCILPAFALLTVAPLLAGALRALRP